MIEHFRGSPGKGQDESGSDPSQHVKSMHETKGEAETAMAECKKGTQAFYGAYYTVEPNRRKRKEPKVEKVEQAELTEESPVLSESAARAMFKKLGHVQGRVPFDLGELISLDLEGFLDVISIRLIGSDLLMDIRYQLCGWDESGVIYIWVVGQLPDEDEGF